MLIITDSKTKSGKLSGLVTSLSPLGMVEWIALGRLLDLDMIEP